MTIKRLIPLLFAVAYVVVPASAVYVQVKLSHDDHAHVMDSSGLPVVPVVMRLQPADQDMQVAL